MESARARAPKPPASTHQCGSIFFDKDGDAACPPCPAGDLVVVGVVVRVEHHPFAIDGEEDGVPQMLIFVRQLHTRAWKIGFRAGVGHWRGGRGGERWLLGTRHGR